MEVKQVSDRAIMKRLNRKYGSLGAQFKKGRLNSRSFKYTGKYYLLKLKSNAIIKTYDNIEELGKELGVLQDYEQVGR